MTDTKTCSSCGAAVPAVAAFCTSCGQPMAEAAPPPPPVPPPPPSADPWSPPAGPGIDETRVDAGGLHDATQVHHSPLPPVEPPAVPEPIGPPPATPWSTGPSSPVPPGPPTTAPWDPPASPPPPTWQHAIPPPTSATFGAAPDPATTWAPPGAAAPPGAWGTPIGSPEPVKGATRSPFGGIAAVAGGILALAGLFSGWVTLDPGSDSETVSLWSLTSGDGLLKSNDAYVIAAFAVVAIVLGILLFTGAARALVRLAVIATGIAIVVTVALNWTSIAGYVTDNLPSSFSAKTAIGFYLAIAGGVLTAIAGLLPARK